MFGARPLSPLRFERRQDGGSLLLLPSPPLWAKDREGGGGSAIGQALRPDNMPTQGSFAQTFRLPSTAQVTECRCMAGTFRLISLVVQVDRWIRLSEASHEPPISRARNC